MKSLHKMHTYEVYLIKTKSKLSDSVSTDMPTRLLPIEVMVVELLS